MSCSEKKIGVDILAEELAYNKKYSQYKLFIIKTPLIETNQHQKKEKGGSLSMEDMLIPRRTTTEHLQLLQCFNKHEEVWLKLLLLLLLLLLFCRY